MTDGETGPASRTPSVPGPEAADGSETRRRRAQLGVMIGLLVTFGGVVAYGLQVPVQPSALSATGPWLAVGFLAAWSGGILAGNSLIPPPPGIPPALRGQAGLAALATTAGILSATVVARLVGPWFSEGPGSPPELVLATAGVILAWLGGFLMGNSMRRFIRHDRRRGGTRSPSDARPAPK